MEFRELLETFTAAACAGDGQGLAACFTGSGTYHDYIYGSFTGRAAIADMLENHFHRDAKDFKWEMLEPVSDGETGYARYLFSFTSTMPDYAGRRVAFEGMSRFKLVDGLIQDYHEAVNAGAAMVQLGVPPAQMVKVLRRSAEKFLARDEAAGHRAA